MKVVLWADAGPAVGFGHLSRALAVAEALGAHGVATRFVVPEDATAIAWCAAAGQPFVAVPGGGVPVAAVRAAAADADAIVIDVRAPLAADTVRTLRDRWPVVAIDNAGPGVALADLVVAPADPPRGPHWLTGPAHVPLRAPARACGVRRVGPGGRPVVLVSMGASDPEQRTVAVAEALARLAAPRVTARVVANPLTPVWATLPGLLGRLGFPPAHPVVPGGMAAHLAVADVAVLALGVTVYEAMAAGVPSVVVCRTAGDGAHADRLAEHGAIVNLGVDPSADALAGAVATLAADRALRTRMAQAGRMLVDGRGAARVAARIVALVEGVEVAHAGGRPLA